MFESGYKFDKYTIDRLLGQGGMGMVYKATNQFGVAVVLKMLHPQFVADEAVAERFRREGRIQYTLKHPNIVRVTDITEHDGIPALVVDFMSGEDLEKRLSRDGPLSIEETIRLSTALLDALELAHENGFVHRDLKPANVFLEDDGKGSFEPRLMDFGIAKIEEAAALTRINEFAGTPAYASPEQIASTKDVDHLTDIYSFGAVMWSMCTGDEPYKHLSADPYAVLNKVVDHQLPPLPGTVPHWLRSLIEKATSKYPRDRFPSAAAFRDALIEAASESDRFAQSVANFEALAGDGAWTTSLPPSAFEETLSDVDISASDREADELYQAAFGPLSTRAKEGLERRRREASGLLTADATPPHPEPGLPSDRMQVISNTEAVREAAAQLHVQASTPKPKLAPERPHRERAEAMDSARVRQIERSYDPNAARRARRRKLLLAAGGLIAIAGAAAVGWWTVTNGPQSAPEGFVRVEPTTFTMGSPAGEPGRNDDERAHDVVITRPFAIQATEVTQQEWTDLMYADPKAFLGCGTSCPITKVTWLDAARFANRYSIRENLDPCYVIDGSEVEWPQGLDCVGYRLPTEAEWELAARAGSETAFSNGTIEHLGRELLDPRLSVVGWYGANSDVTYADGANCETWGPDRELCGPKPVGTRHANDWGLYDMHGNVAEWVWDRYGPYPIDAVVDPTGPSGGVQRVIRGGSWHATSDQCRSAARDHAIPVDRNYVGFRLARTLR